MKKVTGPVTEQRNRVYGSVGEERGAKGGMRGVRGGMRGVRGEMRGERGEVQGARSEEWPPGPPYLSPCSFLWHELCGIKSNWWKYVLAAFLPLTIFYFFVVLFEINVTSSHLHGFVFYCQGLVASALARLMVTNFSNQKAFQIFAIMNLDFFSLLKTEHFVWELTHYKLWPLTWLWVSTLSCSWCCHVYWYICMIITSNLLLLSVNLLEDALCFLDKTGRLKLH